MKAKWRLYRLLQIQALPRQEHRQPRRPRPGRAGRTAGTRGLSDADHRSRRAPQRLRDQIDRHTRVEHLLNAARLCSDHDLALLKLYVLIGLQSRHHSDLGQSWYHLRIRDCARSVVSHRPRFHRYAVQSHGSIPRRGHAQSGRRLKRDRRATHRSGRHQLRRLGHVGVRPGTTPGCLGNKFCQAWHPRGVESSRRSACDQDPSAAQVEPPRRFSAPSA